MKHNPGMHHPPVSPDATASRRGWMLGLGAAAAAAGAGLAWWRLRFAPPLPEAVQAFWNRQFDSPAGSPVALSTFRGRPLLLNFWATWCPPCVEELPMIEAFWRENAPKGHQVLALAVDQPSAVRKFLERQPLGFSIGLAGYGGTELSKSLGNGSGALPFSVFLKADGSIYRQKLGQLTQDDLRDWSRSAS